MGKRAETRDELRKESATKIYGQPTDQDITTLEKELIAIAASIPTRLGGGNHGHAGLIVEPAKYLAMAGQAFIAPPNPGIYPAELAINAAAGTRARAEAEHNELIAQYEIFKGVEQALKDIIQEAVEHDYLLEIEDDTLGFLNQTPRQIIDHLKARGGTLDFADTKTLLAERDTEWDISENPQVYFNRVEKAVKALTRAGISSDMNERRDMALYYLKSTGEFDAAVREWENKAAADKTWTNIKTFISTEYARENKQNKLTAKQFNKANLIQEQAEATEELIATLTENHTRQMEALIKSTTDAMKEMMQLIKTNSGTPTNPTKATDEEKKKKRDERRKRYKEAPVCTHCGKKHPSKKEDECWELEKNKSSRPADWKSSKST